MSAFTEEFEAVYRKQRTEARGQRREMLEGDLTGTKLMLEVLYPVLGSLDGIVLEHEMVGVSGVKIYCDAFVREWGTALEEEHYVTHAEMVTRKRFTFERARARSMAFFGYAYFPYSRDELERNPDICRRDLQQFINARTGRGGVGYLLLSVYEREALRAAFMFAKPFILTELSARLGVEVHTASKIAKRLVSKGYFRKVGGGESRCHAFELTSAGRAVLIGN